MGIKCGAQHNIIKRWRDRNFQIVSHLSNRGKVKMLSEEQQLWIVNPTTLKEQSHLPLRIRAKIIRTRFNLKSFSQNTLRDYYLRRKVRFRRPTYDYQQKHTRAAELQLQQQQFIKELGTCMKEGKREILYVDESTFNLWQYPNRSWLAKGMTVTLAEKRG